MTLTRATTAALQVLHGLCGYLAGLALTVILFGQQRFDVANILALPLAVAWLALTDWGGKVLARRFRKGCGR